ncbi:hypothetical protein Vretimale_589 [Volvox reticuliferus]|nr:hypothetical protein Vretimale_589 [Volvox reticuliferus]
MAGVAGIHVVHAAAADMAGAADSRAAGTSAIPPAIADGMPSGTAPLEACDLPHPGRGGDASGLPLLATTVPPSSKCQQDGALIRSAQQSGDLELNAQAINRQLGREVDTTTSATEGALAAARGAAASVGEALALEPAGVVSSTMAPLLLELGVHDARSQGATGTMPPGVGSPGGPPLALSSCPPGLQAGAAVHTPSWPQLYSAGWGCPGDRYQMGAGHGTTLGEVQPQQQLEQSQQPGVMPGSGATSHLTGALTELGMHGEPGTVAPQTNTPPSIAPPGITASATVPLPIHAHPQSQTSVLPFRHGATFGLLATTAALQLPFLPPPPAIHPPVHAGGPFPGAIPHVPPPRAQWRSSLFGEVPLGGGQPAVSLVEMDVMVRKELILLRWHMLQELAAEIEAEWMEACHAHNRLRLLSMAQSVSTTAAGAVDSADVLGLQVSTHQQPQDTSRACYSYSGAHSHPGLHSLDSQDQESQHQQQEQRAQEQQRQTQQQLINLGQAANPQPAAPMQPPVVLPAAAWATASEALRTMEQTESHSTSRFNALEQAVVEMLPAALRKEAPVDAQEPLDLVRPSFSSDQQAVARHAQHPDQLLHAAAPIQTPALMLEPGRTPEASRGAERSERAALEAVEVACAIGVPVCGSDVHGNWQSGPNVVAPSAEDRQHPGWTQTALDIPTPGTAVAAGVGTSDGAVIVRVEAATWPVGVHFPGLSVIERPPAENPEAVVTASEAAICTQRQDRQHCTQIWQRSDVSPTFHVNVRQGGADADADAADITAVLTGSDTRASPAAAVSNPTGTDVPSREFSGDDLAFKCHVCVKYAAHWRMWLCRDARACVTLPEVQLVRNVTPCQVHVFRSFDSFCMLLTLSGVKLRISHCDDSESASARRPVETSHISRPLLRACRLRAAPSVRLCALAASSFPCLCPCSVPCPLRPRPHLRRRSFSALARPCAGCRHFCTPDGPCLSCCYAGSSASEGRAGVHHCNNVTTTARKRRWRCRRDRQWREQCTQGQH